MNGSTVVLVGETVVVTVCAGVEMRDTPGGGTANVDAYNVLIEPNRVFAISDTNCGRSTGSTSEANEDILFYLVIDW